MHARAYTQRGRMRSGRDGTRVKAQHNKSSECFTGSRTRSTGLAGVHMDVCQAAELPDYG